MIPVNSSEHTGITSREFWSNYWESKGKKLFQKISQTYLFNDLFDKYLPKEGALTFLEIGGFPGYFCIYFKKYFGYEVSLLDYYLDTEIIDRLVKENGLFGEFGLIEVDLFDSTVIKQFDVVLSSGFVEHFKDTQEVLLRHFAYVKPGGYLYVAIPNFRGVNGLMQRIFDPENFSAHNLESMHPELLERICSSNGFSILHAGYYGHFGLWVENADKRPYLLRKFIKKSNSLGRKFLRFTESRLFSPYIVVVCRKAE